MIKFYNSEKIAIIADLHFGIHSNSEQWHKIQLDYGKWLKAELDKQNIQDLIVLGDIFNNREEVGVSTLSVTEQFFRIFTNPISPYNIILLTGNHDSYLRDSAVINSISIFKGWNNVNVIDVPEQAIVNNKTFTFLPWGTSVDIIPTKTDIIFGHLAVNTFKKNTYKLCEDGVDSSVLLDKTDLVISGHFHTREVRNYPDNKRIIYIGATYPQTWNDVDSIKGYYILNTRDLTTEFYENTISPRYYRIQLSDFFQKDKLSAIKQNILANFIKIQVDIPIEYDKFEKILNTIALLNPLEISSDFSDNTQLTVNKDYESVHLDTKTLMSEFIESLDLKNLKDKVLKESEEIYNKALTKVTIENE